MNGAMNETMENIFGKLTTDKFYQSILFTPVSLSGSPSARWRGRCCAASSPRCSSS